MQVPSPRTTGHCHHGNACGDCIILKEEKQQKPVHVPRAPAFVSSRAKCRQLSRLTDVQVRLGGGSTSGRRSD